MDYKKKYEEALENIKKIKSANKDNKELVDFIEYEYPELKESEDERIRKELIRAFTVSADKRDYEIYGNGITYRQVLAWLERLGEQKSKFRVDDTIKCKYDNRQFTIKSVDLDKGTYTYTQEGCGNDIDYADEEFELVEQKPAWSEEDEDVFNDIIIYLNNNFKYGMIDWLKSLKERIKGK